VAHVAEDETDEHEEEANQRERRGGANHLWVYRDRRRHVLYFHCSGQSTWTSTPERLPISQGKTLNPEEDYPITGKKTESWGRLSYITEKNAYSWGRLSYIQGKTLNPEKGYPISQGNLTLLQLNLTYPIKSNLVLPNLM
jgi:hypothetical protein